MAWDLETEPEFDEESGWMRSFIDRALSPLGTGLRAGAGRA
jgi:hypothetical protein